MAVEAGKIYSSLKIILLVILLLRRSCCGSAHQPLENESTRNCNGSTSECRLSSDPDVEFLMESDVNRRLLLDRPMFKSALRNETFVVPCDGGNSAGRCLRGKGCVNRDGYFRGC
ncbi:protein RALF-like 33 [Malania oleifera]|uniref:protein RALF-like 33 n=1 Tax=Malania oleifera TaxID=397392 RepID=UPI0025AE45BD|nr:protein RALF-like 33 [Malania oleifera]